MGVTVFFVLSGFVLALNYERVFIHPTVPKVWNFAVARFARVYPLYFLMLAYLLVSTRAAGAPTDNWLWHVLALQAWHPDMDVAFAYNRPAWSISVEAFLYLSFPLAIYLLTRLRSARSLLVVAGLTALTMVAISAWFTAEGRALLPASDPASAHRWIYHFPALRLGDFVLGILAAKLYLTWRPLPQAKALAPWIAGLSLIIIIALMAWPAHNYTAWSFDVSYALPATLLILGLALAPGAAIATRLSLPLVVLLGEASYAFYLVHEPLMRMFGAGRWANEFSVTNVAFELFTLGFLLLIAVGLHITVERPSRAWIRRRWTSRTGDGGDREPVQADSPAVAAGR